MVLLMGACKNAKNQIMIVTEFASRSLTSILLSSITSHCLLLSHRGDLHHCVKQVEALELRCQMVRQVIQGLQWLTSNGIVHRDLKLDNLLVSHDWSIKITCNIDLAHSLLPDLWLIVSLAAISVCQFLQRMASDTISLEAISNSLLRKY